MAGQLRLALLGRPEISLDGQPLTSDLLSLKGQALLFYLAVTGESCSRNALATLLWGEMAEERAKANLRLALTKMRSLLGPHLIIERQTLAFNFAQPYWLDLEELRAAASAPNQSDPERLRRALALYRGEFLHDFSIADAPPFEDWVRVEQERWRQVAFAAFMHLAQEARRAGGEYDAGIQATRTLLTFEPWHEEAHQQLMWLLAHSGQRSAALAQYESCRRALAEELAVEPSPATTTLYEQIKREAPATATAQLQPLRSPPLRARPPQSNLPWQHTTLVGRERELDRIKQLLGAPECLLTLVGPGGIGKSRLAVAAAEAQQENFRDGVVFVPLVGITSGQTDETAEMLVTGIGNALGYVFSAQRPPREVLVQYLADKRILLLLDNFEQLLPAAAILEEFLRHAPALKFLVTSRIRLGIETEWLLDVEGLAYPPASELDTAAEYPAVELFCQAARRIKADFACTAGYSAEPTAERAAIHRICQLVAGFPLAIELAANWVRGLSCTAIVARLEASHPATPAGGLEMLATTTAIVPARHQSMRVVLDYSWEQLTSQEQQAFRQLSVFQGGFELDAAETVTQATPPVVASLTDKSWLRRDDKTGRYLIHELLRQYGAEQLAHNDGEERATLAAHSRYYSALLTRHSAELEAGAETNALAILDREVENIRFVWERLIANQEIEAIVAYLDALWPYYEHKGWLQEAVFVLNQARRLSDAPPLHQARWHRWLGQAHYQMGQLDQSHAHFEEAMVLLGRPLPASNGGWLYTLLRQSVRQTLHRLLPLRLERAPERRLAFTEAARIFGSLGQIYLFREEALPMLTVSIYELNLSERAGATPETALGYSINSLTHSNVPLPRLAAFYDRLARQKVHAIDKPAIQAYVAEIIGVYNLGCGQWAEATEALIRSAALLARLGLRRWWDETRLLLALVAYHQGKFGQSAQHFSEVLHSARHHNDPLTRFWSLLGIVECGLRLGELDAGALESYLDEARALPQQYLGNAERIRLHGVSALVHLRQGNAQLALESAQLTARLMQQGTFWIFWSIEGYAAPAEVFLDLWEKETATAGARASANRYQQAAKHACQAMHRFARIYPPGQPRAWLYQGLYHWLEGKPTQAHAYWRKSLAAATQRMMPYEEARAHVEINRHLPPDDPVGQEHRARAAEIFTQLEIASLSHDA